MTRHKNLSKTWIKPELKASATPQEKFLFALLPKENPFLSMIASEERHLDRIEAEVRNLRDLMSNHRTSYP